MIASFRRGIERYATNSPNVSRSSGSSNKSIPIPKLPPPKELVNKSTKYVIGEKSAKTKKPVDNPLNGII